MGISWVTSLFTYALLACGSSTPLGDLFKDPNQRDIVPTCLKPPSIENAFLTLPNGGKGAQKDLSSRLFSIGEMASYHCLPGYFAGKPTRVTLKAKCKEAKDGSPYWDVRGSCSKNVKCNEPPQLPHSDVAVRYALKQEFNPGEKVEYQCNDGFVSTLGNTAPYTKCKTSGNRVEWQPFTGLCSKPGPGIIPMHDGDGATSTTNPEYIEANDQPELDDIIHHFEADHPEYLSGVDYQGLHDGVHGFTMVDCLRDGKCESEQKPTKTRAMGRLRIAKKFHNPFHQFGIMEAHKQHQPPNYPTNLLYELPEPSQSLAGSRWIRHHPRLPPPVCDGPNCDSIEGPIDFSVAIPDSQTRHPDSTEDVIRAAVPMFGSDPEEETIVCLDKSCEKTKKVKGGDDEKKIVYFPPKPFAEKPVTQKWEPAPPPGLHRELDRPCHGADCPRNKEKQEEVEVPTVSKPYPGEPLSQQWSPQQQGEHPQMYKPVPQPPGPPCGDKGCGYTEEGEKQGIFNAEFEEFEASEGPDDNTAEEGANWIDCLMNFKKMFKLLALAFLVVAIVYSILKCWLCSAVEEGSLGQEGGTSCWETLIGEKSCAAGAVDDKSECP